MVPPTWRKVPSHFSQDRRKSIRILQSFAILTKDLICQNSGAFSVRPQKLQRKRSWKSSNERDYFQSSKVRTSRHNLHNCRRQRVKRLAPSRAWICRGRSPARSGVQISQMARYQLLRVIALNHFTLFLWHFAVPS